MDLYLRNCSFMNTHCAILNHFRRINKWLALLFKHLATLRRDAPVFNNVHNCNGLGLRQPSLSLLQKPVNHFYSKGQKPSQQKLIRQLIINILQKMKNIFNYLLLLVCLASCNSHTNTAKKEVTAIDTATTDSSTTLTINKDSINYPAADSAEHIYLNKSTPAKTISGKLEGQSQSFKIYIDKNAGDTLHVFIEPSEKDANIRLNQIISPYGKADGPFGRDQKFALKNNGMYQLIIGNNLMAEGKRKTAFNLHLSVH